MRNAMKTVPSLSSPSRVNPLPRIEWFRDRFSYDPSSGLITGPSGRSVGCLTAGGFVVVKIQNDPSMLLRAHRLAFMLVEGREPAFIEHVNGDRSDNRWINLREKPSARYVTPPVRGSVASLACGFGPEVPEAC